LVSLGQFLNFLIEFLGGSYRDTQDGLRYRPKLYRERVPVGFFRQSASRQVAGDDEKSGEKTKMTPEQQQELNQHIQAIAKILHQEAEAEKIQTLEGIETTIREQT